jgi:phosphoglycerate-specific signal transduction histidine kinase
MMIIVIKDSGKGMSKEIMDQLLPPLNFPKRLKKRKEWVLVSLL